MGKRNNYISVWEPWRALQGQRLSHIDICPRRARRAPIKQDTLQYNYMTIGSWWRAQEGMSVASLAGFEPAARCLEGSRSIHLSYRDALEGVHVHAWSSVATGNITVKQSRAELGHARGDAVQARPLTRPCRPYAHYFQAVHVGQGSEPPLDGISNGFAEQRAHDDCP